MDRPQGGGMERVSLITLLQKQRQTQKDRKNTERGYRAVRQTVNYDYHLFIVRTENVLTTSYNTNGINKK